MPGIGLPSDSKYWSALVALLSLYLCTRIYRASSASTWKLSEGKMAAAAHSLKFLTVHPRTKHSATVIFVHGLGDTGYGWKPVADIFGADSALSHIKWILPHAPTMAVTANGGMEMPSWFDILDFDWRTREDEAGMRKTITSLGTFLDSEVAAGIPANRIVLGGFSQGGAISLLTALTSDKKLGGVTVLSGWLPLHQKIKSMVTSNNVTTPLFWGHGEDDPLVEFDMGVRSVEFLKKEFSIPTADPESPEKGGLMFNSYEDLPHSTSNEELRDLKEWLKKVLPNA